MDQDTSRRDLLTSVAKALPFAAVAVAAGDRSVAAAPRGGNSATALISSFNPNTGGFVGTVTVTGVQVVNGVLQAVVEISGNVVNGLGAPVAGSPITQNNLAVPLQVTGTCEILNLVLGPLDLNLLGLQIHLNQVVLTIVAVSGAGNLLGNLLCAVANLLNGGGPIQTLLNNLVNLLNQILGAL